MDFLFSKCAQCHVSVLAKALEKEEKKDFTLGTKRREVSGKSFGSL